MATKILRQGDVGLIRVSALPEAKDGRRLVKSKRRLIRRGENGGVHELETLKKATIYELFGSDVQVKEPEQRFIEVTEPTRVVHKEHAPIDLKPGVYQIAIQREFLQNQVRFTAD